VLSGRPNGFEKGACRKRAGDGGWAADLIGKRKPSFADLEEKAEMQHWRPYYKMASHNVHAESHGILWRLGAPVGSHVILSGPSLLGLADPAHGAAVNLLRITVVVVCSFPLNMDRLVGLRILESLVDEVGRKALVADARAKELFKES